MGRLLSVASLIALCALAVGAQESEKPVKMKNVPQPVQATVVEQSKGATVKSLAKETDDGKTYYELSLIVNGRNRDVLIDPDGKVVEVEDAVSLDSLPELARAEIRKQAGNRKIVLVESITKEGAVVAYEAHTKRGWRTSEVKVTPAGQLIQD
jgi:hypothetical protein